MNAPGEHIRSIKYAHDSAAALLSAFYTVKNQRDATRGAATDEEQDILRSMVVTAGAGLDSTIKQLFRDALPTLVQYDPQVCGGLQKFIARELKEHEGTKKLYDEIASTFVTCDPLSYWTERYV